MTLESELETIRTNIVTNLTSKGVTASNTESLNDLVGKVNTVKTPITSSLVLKETYQNDISGVVDCLRDKFRINLSKQGVETLSTDGLTTLSNSISLIKFDTVLTLTSDKTSASTGETVTLTATLVDINGNPVSGATVVFMEGSSTLYSGITNILGNITYTYSSTKDINLKAIFNGNINYNNSTSPIINISNYLFIDDCTGAYSDKYTAIQQGLGSYTKFNGLNCIKIMGANSRYVLNKINNINVSNFKLTCKMALPEFNYNNIDIAFRGVIGSYCPVLDMSSSFAITYGDTLGSSDLRNNHKTVRTSNITNTWYSIILQVVGNQITVQINNETPVVYTDNNMASSGIICIGNLSPSSNWEGYFADIKIKQL